MSNTAVQTPVFTDTNAPAAERRRHRLLIVDDEPDVLASLRGMFRRDYEVLAAESAIDALELMRRHDVHVVISDQRMPDMTGTDFFAQVSQEFPHVIRVMITGYSEIDSVIDAINRGHVFRYVSKPWDPAELELVIRQAAAQYELIEERQRLLHALQEANKLKTAFITVASHELNTPLTIVMGMLQLANARCDDAGVRGYIDRAQNAARRLLGLLTNTFKLLQQEDFHHSLERESVDCRALLEEIAVDMAPFLQQRNHVLRIELGADELYCRASRIHLRDVLENLVTNAIKFSQDGSTIRLVADRVDDGQIRFQVIDTGVGIAWEDQPHVFEPLFSTWDTMHHSSGDYGYCKRGMGLGLAIVKHFVEMHGGCIDFASVPQQGTTFRITLPAE